jgi:hypothetical protein
MIDFVDPSLNSGADWLPLVRSTPCIQLDRRFSAILAENADPISEGEAGTEATPTDHKKCSLNQY